MFFLPLLFFFISLFLVISYCWSRRKLYWAAQCLNGPWPSLPVIGNALYFNCKNEEILSRINQMILSYRNPLRFWLGPQLMIMFFDPEDAERIVTSQKLSYKHETYNFLKVILGEGLITSSGAKNRQHRKIVQPMLSHKFCAQPVEIYQRHIDLCLQKLEPFENGPIFDICNVIHRCIADIVGEIILGYDINFQNYENEEYFQAFIDVYDLGFARMVKPWLHNEFLYKFTSHKKEMDKNCEMIHSFFSQVITESWMRRKLLKTEQKFVPLIDQLADFIEQNPDSINREDFVSHLMSLYAASEDTITIIVSFATMCFGMYPEYQDKAVAEIREVIGKDRAVSLEDLSNLPYLDKCVKDIFRLAPIGPYIIRRTIEDQNIGKYFVPKGCAVIVAIYNLHRLSSQWENPHHFHPDHFLSEAVHKRHPYSYLPFSAGPRGCVGRILANLVVKLMLVNLLRRYEFRREGKFPDVKLRMDISIRPIEGYKVQIVPRKW